MNKTEAQHRGPEKRTQCHSCRNKKDKKNSGERGKLSFPDHQRVPRDKSGKIRLTKGRDYNAEVNHEIHSQRHSSISRGSRGKGFGNSQDIAAREGRKRPSRLGKAKKKKRNNLGVQSYFPRKTEDYMLYRLG